MEKSSISNYGWIAICVVIAVMMIALASPFGTAIRDKVIGNVNSVTDKGQINIQSGMKTYTLSGDVGTNHTIGDTSGLTFSSDATLREFQKVKIDGKVVKDTNYDVAEGDTVTVSINADYVNALFQGTHSVELVSFDGSAKSESAFRITYNATLNKNSWEQIHEASESGNIPTGWTVGSTKSLQIKGTVGSVAMNQNINAILIGINHNAAVEGTGLTFRLQYALIDSSYTTSVTSSTAFNMNHTGDTNAGGWQESDIRYNILGSVNEKGIQSATPSTTSRPVANTLMAALPEDLRNVLQPIKKFTDNTGSASTAGANVTYTIDYLPLLSEYEICGSRTGANATESSKQAQYAYFTTVANRKVFKYNSTTSATAYWCRSPYSVNAIAFCGINTSGTSIAKAASTSYGIVPIFKV